MTKVMFLLCVSVHRGVPVVQNFATRCPTDSGWGVSLKFRFLPPDIPLVWLGVPKKIFPAVTSGWGSQNYFLVSLPCHFWWEGSQKCFPDVTSGATSRGSQIFFSRCLSWWGGGSQNFFSKFFFFKKIVFLFQFFLCDLSSLGMLELS